MRIVKALSIIALAGYLVLQGIFYIAELQSPTLHAFIGILGLTAGALMFISLGHWIEHKDHIHKP